MNESCESVDVCKSSLKMSGLDMAMKVALNEIWYHKW